MMTISFVVTIIVTSRAIFTDTIHYDHDDSDNDGDEDVCKIIFYLLHYIVDLRVLSSFNNNIVVEY